MELTTITRRVGEICGLDVSAIEPDPRFVGPAGWQGREGEAALAREQEAAAATPAPSPATPVRCARRRDAGGSCPRREPSEAKRADRPRRLTRSVRSRRPSFKPGSPARRRQAMSLSMCRRPRPTRCRPISSASRWRSIPGKPATSRSDIASARTISSAAAALCPDQIREEEAIALLKPLLEAPGVLKIGHDVKFDMQVFAPCAASTIAPIDDTMLISYALDGGLAGDVHGLDELAETLPRPQADRAERGRRLGPQLRRLRARRDRQGVRIRAPRTPTSRCACGGR